MPLRPYQLRASERLRLALDAGLRPLLVAPTGSGKTCIAADVAAHEVRRGGHVLVLAPSREIVAQTVGKLRAAGLDPGVVQAGTARGNPDAPVQVATVQTLQRRGVTCLRHRPALIIYDEAHRSPSAGYRAVRAWFPEAKSMGETATPWRLDGQSLRGPFDNVVVAASPRELMDLHFLAPCDVHAFGEPDLSRVRVRSGDYQTLPLEQAVNTTVLRGDVVDTVQRLASGRRTLLFAASVQHSRDLVADLQAAGIRAEHLDGTTLPDDRQRLLDRLTSGDLQLLSNCATLTEGVDLPAVEVGILARPTQSLTLYLQMAGRILRPSPGKARALLIDHGGNVARHGLPDDDRDYSLTGDARPLPEPHTCPECQRVYRSASCPACQPQRRARPLRLVVEADAQAVRIDGPEGVETPPPRETPQETRLSGGAAAMAEALQAMLIDWTPRTFGKPPPHPRDVAA